MKNDPQILAYLKTLDKSSWYDVLDKCFNYKALPTPLVNDEEYISDYLIKLNRLFIGSKDIDALQTFHDTLLEYYFNLPVVEENYDKIYTLHWIFGAIKLRTNYNYKLNQRLNSETLKAHDYEGKINLHASLLSLLIDLPKIEGERISAYLFGSHQRIQNYAFFRVALRHFIKRNSEGEYFDYFLKISATHQSERFAKMLTESLIDLRDQYGSFKPIVEGFETYRAQFLATNEVLSQFVADILNRKLKKGNPLYDDDVYAMSLKALINVNSSYAWAPALLKDIYEKISIKDGRQYIYGILSEAYKRKKWENNICFDNFGLDNESNRPLYISIDSEDDKAIQYYSEIYNTDPKGLMMKCDNDDFYNTFYTLTSNVPDIIKQSLIKNSKSGIYQHIYQGVAA